ncbi:hypothetical protein CN176_03450 [Sinorhizobium medicae]|uniref:hypothetical protein n=1 Tax=Sinorhizobium medicae TaxID=110321 RepID=UPI000FD8BDB7|nr:hypothetical protein [Sinorhizobium medicae]RVJ45853.1 hypothetical protein CN176_03450 [Sinorhizobium medicae]
MKNVEKRIRTLQLLVGSSTAIQDATKKAAVLDELDEIRRGIGIQPLRRRRLLNILHLARSLETSLRAVVDANTITLPKDKRNMGGYLNALAQTSPPMLTHGIKEDCIKRVTNLRNKIAHGAGNYPANDQLLDAAMQSAHSCLAMILR